MRASGMWMALVLTAGLLGCGSARDGEGGAAAGGQAPERAVAEVKASVPEAVVTRLGAGEPFEVTAARPYEAEACVQGTRAGLELLVCRYGDESAADGARARLSAFLGGAVTGVIAREGVDVVVVADKAGVDPQGFEVSRLVKAFSGGGEDD